MSAYIFGVTKSYIEIYKISQNSVFSLWLSFIKRSNLLLHLDNKSKNNFILNEAASFIDITKRSEYILSGSIEYEDSVNYYSEISLFNNNDIKLAILINKNK